jgi:hypothetical protein
LPDWSLVEQRPLNIHGWQGVFQQLAASFVVR